MGITWKKSSVFKLSTLFFFLLGFAIFTMDKSNGKLKNPEAFHSSVLHACYTNHIQFPLGHPSEVRVIEFDGGDKGGNLVDQRATEQLLRISRDEFHDVQLVQGISEDNRKVEYASKDFAEVGNSQQGTIPSKLPASYNRSDNGNDYSHKYPEGILIGVRKGGTGPLAQFLGLNPKIRPTPGEMKFFNSNNTFRKGENWYIHQMPVVHSDEISIEKTADYFTHPLAPVRIKGMRPNQKVLLILRNPIKRLISEHYHHLRRTQEGRSLDYIWTYGKGSFDEIVMHGNQTNQSYEPLNRSFYLKHLRQWFKHFDRKQVLVINGDTFIQENPAKTLHKVEDFLGVPNYITKDMFFFNEAKGFYCSRSLGCLESKGFIHPAPQNKTIEVLKDFFKPHNELLFNLLGYNFSWD